MEIVVSTGAATLGAVGLFESPPHPTDSNVSSETPSKRGARILGLQRLGLGEPTQGGARCVPAVRPTRRRSGRRRTAENR